VKHHPSSVDLELVKRLLQLSKQPTLKKFLCHEFSCISPDLASAPLLRSPAAPRRPTRRSVTVVAQRIQLSRLPTRCALAQAV